jgi:hypothetical protein
VSTPATSGSSFSYAVIRYLADIERDVTVPVGIILCNAERQWLQFRLPRPEERIPEVSLATAQPLLQLAEAKIQRWLQSGDVPLADHASPPLTEAWWEQVRNLMAFRVRLGEVQAIDCLRPEEEIDTLFEAIVHPQVSQKVRRSRIDGVVRRALGNLARRFQHGQCVTGFHNRPVPVLRYLSGQRSALVVEAINFAASTAEKDADAMTSKLERIRAGSANTRFVVGYLASPSGLNGEGVLKEWVEHKMGIELYDLTRDEGRFRSKVIAEINEIGDALNVLGSGEAMPGR